MAKLAKFLQGVAGAAGGAALNVEDVFSTYLYTGNGSTQTITNGIDLAGEGGLVWTKSRTEKVYTGYDHTLFDTERGIDKRISTNTTAAQVSGMTFSATSTGFTDGYNTVSTEDMVSWTFRKAPKFFDVVTYTGNGTAGRTVSHNLGTDVGFMVIKQTSASGEHWICYHRSLGASSPIYLNLTSAASASTSLPFNSTAPTSTEFTLGNWSAVNGNGASYVAYLFAHNDGDGDFGPTGDQDIIKCGSIDTGATGTWTENLGFEPQWILLKRSDNIGGWFIYDAMRGIVSGGNDAYLYANSTSSETTSGNYIELTPTGFKNDPTDGTNRDYIYIAIRRGPMALPESATDVFDIATRDATPPAFNSSFDAVDFALYRSSVAGAADWYAATRLTSPYILKTNATDAEINGGTGFVMDYSGGWYGPTQVNSGSYSWMWKRAPNFFDVVAYKGTDVYGSDIAHNLGVAPEMIWVKNRNRGDSAAFWAVYHKDLTATDYLKLNVTSAAATSSGWWADTEPTATHFTIGNQASVNSTDNFIAYLFASLDGISKVGSYTGNGSSQTIDCGFSSGARFVLIRGYNSAANNWWIFDSERGIVAGNDPYLPLNENIAQTTSYDPIDPHSSGFTVNNVTGGSLVNYSGRNYIFYAIA